MGLLHPGGNLTFWLLPAEVTLLMAELAKSISVSIPRKTLRGEYLARLYQTVGDQRKEFIVRLFGYLPGEVETGSKELLLS